MTPEETKLALRALSAQSGCNEALLRLVCAYLAASDSTFEAMLARLLSELREKAGAADLETSIWNIVGGFRAAKGMAAAKAATMEEA